MLQKEAHYCIGFLMQESQIKSDSFLITQDWPFLVGKLTGMFATLKKSTKIKLGMLNDQAILFELVRLALDALRFVKTSRYQDEEVPGHAVECYEGPEVASRDDHPVAAKSSSSTLKGVSVRSLDKLNSASTEPKQGSPPEPPKGGGMAGTVPALTPATNWVWMATTQPAPDAHWEGHSGCTSGDSQCEHSQETNLLWQRLESCRKEVAPSLIDTMNVSAQDETHECSQVSVAAKWNNQIAPPPVQGMPKGSPPAVPAVVVPAQANAQTAADWSPKMGEGQATKTEAKLPGLSPRGVPGSILPYAAGCPGGPSPSTTATTWSAGTTNIKPGLLGGAVAVAEAAEPLLGPGPTTPTLPGPEAGPASTKAETVAPGLAAATAPLDSAGSDVAGGCLGDPRASLQKLAPPNYGRNRCDICRPHTHTGAVGPTPIDAFGPPQGGSHEPTMLKRAATCEALLPPELATPEPTGEAIESAAAATTVPGDLLGVAVEKSTCAKTTLTLMPYTADTNTLALSRLSGSCSLQETHAELLQGLNDIEVLQLELLKTIEVCRGGGECLGHCQLRETNVEIETIHRGERWES